MHARRHNDGRTTESRRSPPVAHEVAAQARQDTQRGHRDSMLLVAELQHVYEAVDVEARVDDWRALHIGAQNELEVCVPSTKTLVDSTSEKSINM